ncbi:uncharacterized protein LOC134957121 [Pseudophryne corroboree]|uniref:uncharacterized protein LOC134957121 n=1 Tax=Pseudophryne corroboree TaxID=495146 RepID=UPI003081D928
MASCQDSRALPGHRGTLHKTVSDTSPFRLSACGTLHETLEEEDNEEEDVSRTALDYIQQLHSVLGQETAEYFLNPPPMDFQVSPFLQKILDGMEDTLGAEELWRILQEKSKQKLQKVYGELIGEDTLNISRDLAQRPVMQKVSRKRNNLIYIKQILETQQRLTNVLLSENPLPDVDDSQGLEGPTRYLPQTRSDPVIYSQIAKIDAKTSVHS